jgi:hypothetical protein
MGFQSFREYLAAREGFLLPDRSAAPGMSRLNPYPVTQARLKRILAKPPDPARAAAAASRRAARGIDYRAAVDHGVVP